MLPQRVWSRHANPKSGWTRLAAYPLLVYAVYARSNRLLAAVVAFLAINPFLFPAPETEPDDWMYRAVRAEEWWSDQGRPFVGVGYPQVLSLFGLLAFSCNLYAARKRRPVATVIATVATMGLKLWFVDELVRRHEAAG